MLTVGEAKKLTVNDLKVELKARGAATTGKKQELQDRLVDLLEKDPPNQEEDVENKEADIQMAPEEDKNDDVGHQESSAIASSDIAISDAAEAVESSSPAQPNVKTSRAAEGGDDNAMNVETSRKEETVDISSTQSINANKDNETAYKPNVPDTSHDVEVDYQEESKSPSQNMELECGAAAAPETNPEENQTVAPPAEATTEQSPTLERQASTDKPIADESKSKEEELKKNLLRKKALSTENPTPHVRIDYFQRPLNPKALMAWLSDLLDIHITTECIWLNNIKTHCYLDFDSVEQAKLCISRVTGRKFPSTSTALLQAHFTNVSARDAANHAEAWLMPAEWRKAHADGASKVGEKAGAKRKVSDLDAGDTPSTSQNQHSATSSNLLRKVMQGNVASPKSGQTEGVSQQGGPARVERLEDYFKKTEAQPSLYWLPVSEEVVERRKSLKERLGK